VTVLQKQTRPSSLVGTCPWLLGQKGISKQLFRFYRNRQIHSLFDPPLAVKLVHNQLSVSPNDGFSWRTSAQIFQKTASTSISSHVGGHVFAVANQAVFSQENSAIFILDDDSEAGGSAGIDRSTRAIEPGQAE